MVRRRAERRGDARPRRRRARPGVAGRRPSCRQTARCAPGHGPAVPPPTGRRARRVPRRPRRGAARWLSASCSRSARRSSSSARGAAAPLDRRWTYWGYGWIASDGGGNPYVDPPADFPQSPAADYVGADWRDTTTVYGPLFTLLSEPVALLAGSSADAAAWLFKGLAAAGARCRRSGRPRTRPALAVALVAWNPVLAIHLAGGGHNDALVGGLAALGVALAVRHRATSPASRGRSRSR